MTWPRKLTSNRQYSRFKANYSQTVDLLERELSHLGAHSIAVQLAIRPEDIRLGGQMRAYTQPSHPGVILSFTGRYGAVTMPCDRYTHWHDNLRAIAVSLEALRAVDRHGVTTSGEQYKGWKQLPSGIEMGPAVDTMTVEDAARVIAAMCSIPDFYQPMIGAVDTFKTLYRRVALESHPDVGGNRAKWDKFQQAADVLKKHHGIS